MLRGCHLGFSLVTMLAGSVAAAPVGAQAVPEIARRIVLSGDAPSACVITNPTGEPGINASFSRQSSAISQIAITRLVDPVTSTALASALTVDLPVVCNTSHVLTVRSTNGGLTRVGAHAGTLASGGFSEFLPYRVSVDWGGQSMTKVSDAGTVRLALGSAMQGTARIAFAIVPGGAPLVSGQYNDALVIELAPNN